MLERPEHMFDDNMWLKRVFGSTGVSKDDNVVLFLSSHGSCDNVGSCPMGLATDFKDDRSIFTLQDLMEAIAVVEFKNMILFVNGCFARQFFEATDAKGKELAATLMSRNVVCVSSSDSDEVSYAGILQTAMSQTLHQFSSTNPQD